MACLWACYMAVWRQKDALAFIRKLLVACLPHVTTINNSKIDARHRIMSERHYIRFHRFSGKDGAERLPSDPALPGRYHELTASASVVGGIGDDGAALVQGVVAAYSVLGCLFWCCVLYCFVCLCWRLRVLQSMASCMRWRTFRLATASAGPMSL